LDGKGKATAVKREIKKEKFCQKMGVEVQNRS
jgi:hypothetical protein